MKIDNLKHILLLLLLVTIFSSCTETYPLLTNTYEEAIVVEATLTNELKNQEIKISKTARFEDDGVETEKDAIVILKDNLNNEYKFNEKSGMYISQSIFQILPNREYTLEIKTTDGKVYKSTPETLTTVTPIESIIPTITTNKDNEIGVQININSYDPTNTSKYYRYEYEETYKIVAPRWSSLKLTVTGTESIQLIPNSINTRVCYLTKNSTDIILFNTNDQTEDRVNLPIRFINKNNYIIGERYSVLVKQYVENLEAYNFHKVMRDISSSSSVLSPKQPGIITGNIRCISDSNTKVIGYFDVASISSQRIFFNYNDVFPNTPKPPYIVECDDIPFSFCFRGDDCSGPSLIYNVENNLMSYISNNSSNYILTPVECGDCTSFSSNKIPSFWTN
ncbi:DUF4249 domain-containing protein [Flavobacterium frigoris]|uniref:DUF4249 domain-containing protein n=1 Tax=Flavobacterium frigoris (strain PS1) TaxID=1086011 RepID=H7FQL4_FLAFP|nr:DUF4249 domain-containing protein [Flavobacterium frigoris]EIA09144.1 hypothetical protein HJ01_01530 [Flavobacterium frigoris PS1]